MCVLNRQYELVKIARSALLLHFSDISYADLNKSIAGFNNRSIAGLHTHVANVYLWWIARITLQKEVYYFDEQQPKNLATLDAHFAAADRHVADFTDHFSENPDVAFDHPDRPAQRYTALEIFTHVITHEFHHKGQLVTMGRMLGYPPPDTDLIRF